MAFLPVPENRMRYSTIGIVALAILAQVAMPGSTRQARAQADKAPYPAMAPPDRYLS
jgi:hypothetical protein